MMNRHRLGRLTMVSVLAFGQSACTAMHPVELAEGAVGAW
jgi:hypothetical protein